MREKPDKINAYFEEIQNFDQLWLKLLVFLTPVMLVLINIVLAMKESISILNFKDALIDYRMILTIAGISALSYLVLRLIKLETIIDKNGLHVRFFPAQRKYRTYTKSEIAEFYKREYNSLTEYGGWGIRYSLKDKSTAYNTSGNIGIQIITNSGKKVLIGTKNAEMFLQALNRL